MEKILFNILFAFLSVGGIGVLFGLGLAFASKVLYVKKDQLLLQVEEALPGLNCGACGYAGCSSYAEAVAKNNEDITLCSAGGEETAKALGNLLGKKVEVAKERNVAQVHCRGGKDKAKLKYIYDGLADCNALFALYGGNKICSYGCLGLGSCVKVCPADAISYDDSDLVWVDKTKCISCGKCITECPTKVMQYIPEKADVFVACNSTDKGPLVRKYCSVGCIGCKMCEKKSPEGGFVVEDFLARIDYGNTGSRQAAVEKCPPKCIIQS